MIPKVALFFLMACVALCEEASPSLNETAKFLADKISAKGWVLLNGSGHYGEHKFRVIGLKNGILKISVRSERGDENGEKSLKNETVSIPLREINLSSIEVSTTNVRPLTPGELIAAKLVAAGERKVIERKDDDTGKATMVSQFSIYLDDKDSAERVVRALKHAVKLLGGKEELF